MDGDKLGLTDSEILVIEGERLMLFDCETFIDLLEDCGTLGLTDDVTLGESLVEGETLMLSECETLIDSLEDCGILGPTGGVKLKDRPAERETLILTECENLEVTLQFFPLYPVKHVQV